QTSAVDCHAGIYRLEDGRVVDIAASAEGALRWRSNDGNTGSLRPDGDVWKSTLGWTGRTDGHRITPCECGTRRLAFDAVSGRVIELRTTDVRFVSNGVSLAGRLVMPPGQEKVPLVVLVHGSEQTSARENFALQRQFPASGIGAFVYDKRGTGGS